MLFCALQRVWWNSTPYRNGLGLRGTIQWLLWGGVIQWLFGSGTMLRAYIIRILLWGKAIQRRRHQWVFGGVVLHNIMCLSQVLSRYTNFVSRQYTNPRRHIAWHGLGARLFWHGMGDGLGNGLLWHGLGDGLLWHGPGDGLLWHGLGDELHGVRCNRRLVWNIVIVHSRK